MYFQTLILGFSLWFSNSERITKIDWWWGQLRNGSLSENNEILNIPKFRNNSIIFDEEGNLKGSYCITKEIDGVYRCAIGIFLGPDDVLYQLNSEVSSKWVSKQEWRFYREDIQDFEMAYYEHINLIFGGIDTYADVLFANETLEIDNNMFIQQILDIKKHYMGQVNYISLISHPPVSTATHLYNMYAKTTSKLYPECLPKSYDGDCYIYMIRKMQSSFGSIIGPSVPSMGISGPAYIEGYNETVIRHVLTHLEESNDIWLLSVTVYLAENQRRIIKGSIELAIVEVYEKNVITIKPDANNEYLYQHTLIIPKKSVEPWWPVGYGNHKLYDLNVKFVSFLGEKTEKTLRVGFRTVELVQEKVGNGTSFYFKINDRPIFIKGTVLVPISLQPELAQDKKRIKDLFTIIQKSNINLIRVWGGGLYQTDLLYDMADQLGILIWQDFMFTDFSYPVNEEFLSTVQKEVKYQVRRLYSHPSVILFCGNDEGEQSIAENRYNQTKSNRTRDDYKTLFVDTIKKVFDEVTFGEGLFLTSTPSNGGLGTEIIENPNDPNVGDVHLHYYKGDLFDHETYYVIPRFVSAYGIQSIPNLNSFRKDTSHEPFLNMKGYYMKSRNHWPDGQDKLEDMFEYQLKLPTYVSDYYNEAFEYYSQVIQAYAMRIQTEKYRSYRSILDENGHGQTMGTIYWHFNDVWTGMAWSSVDYYGKWKIMQYYVEKFFAPHIITGQIYRNGTKKSLKLFVVADVTGLENVVARIKTARWDSIGTNSETNLTISVDADSSKQIYLIEDIEEYFSERNCSIKDCFFYLELDDGSEPVAPDNFIFPHPLKDSNVGEAKIKLRLKKLPYVQIYEIELTTDRNAAFVWVDCQVVDGHFSENAFLMLTEQKKIFFYSDDETNEDELRKLMTADFVGYSFDP